jgi:serine/threonine-protein kinase HipA
MKCLLCYKNLDKSETDYHNKCIMKVFGLKQMPVIDIDEKKLKSYAKKIVGANMAITGVQPKLSLWLEKNKRNIRLTVVDDKSNYIIKPQSETYKALPENEDLCMHLAANFGIRTANHGLVRLPSGELAYITQRFDRIEGSKLACEDLCQLTETLTEHKYRGSYEKTGKTIKENSTQAGMDVLRFFELVLFSFITGNADMHLKNFSMLDSGDGSFTLSPAYDLVSTLLVIKNEPAQMSLTINSKKNKISKKDFELLGEKLSLTEKQRLNCYRSFMEKMEEGIWWIKNSFLPNDHKEKLLDVVSTRFKLFN